MKKQPEKQKIWGRINLGEWRYYFRDDDYLTREEAQEVWLHTRHPMSQFGLYGRGAGR